MPRGGCRPGAGRPKGAKNKLTMMREVAAQYGATPLDYLLSLVWDEALPVEVRLMAARAALPFCTPRLLAVREVVGNGPRDHAEWVRQMEGQLRVSVEAPAVQA